MAQKNKLREEMSKAFLDALNKGQIPWYACWQNTLPYNGSTGRRYQSTNVVYLNFVAQEKGYSDPRWCTYNQATQKGWQVRKGEKSTPVEYWAYYDRLQRKLLSWDEVRPLLGTDYEKKNLILRAKIYNVFNAEQMDGVPALRRNQTDIGALRQQRDTLLQNMAVGYQEKGREAYYSPSADQITLPPEGIFDDPYAYMCTFLHEAGHATGHRTRLNRDLTGKFGSESYAREELRAEIASAFTAQAIGLQLTQAQLQDHMNLHLAYVQNWAKILQDKPGELYSAIQDAEKISDYLLEKGGFTLAQMPEELTDEEETQRVVYQDDSVQVDGYTYRIADEWTDSNDNIYLLAETELSGADLGKSYFRVLVNGEPALMYDFAEAKPERDVVEADYNGKREAGELPADRTEVFPARREALERRIAAIVTELGVRDDTPADGLRNPLFEGQRTLALRREKWVLEEIRDTGRRLMATDVTDIQRLGEEIFDDGRTHVYTFQANVRGVPDTITYERTVEDGEEARYYIRSESTDISKRLTRGEAEVLSETLNHINQQAEIEQTHEDRLRVVLVEAGKFAEIGSVGAELEDLQAAVGGMIEAVYPYDDPVALICNEEGKLNGLPLNRALRDENGEIYDIVAGKFLIVGLGEEDFCSLTDELAEKYAAMFRTPEQFVRLGDRIMALPMEQEESSDIQKQVPEQAADSFSIYQLKSSEETMNLRFASLDRVHAAGMEVQRDNYDLIYTAPLSPGETLEDIYRRFNLEQPEDFTGHSLSVSDVVVLHQNGENTAHYCDSFGFTDVPEFLQPSLAPEIDNGKAEQGMGYQVVVYHHTEKFFDGKAVYATFQEAMDAASGYVDGTMEPDGFRYDGAAIYSFKENRYILMRGDFPDEKAQADLFGSREPEPHMTKGFGQAPNTYYYPELDLHGSATWLYTQAVNGYIESPEALRKVEEIMSNPVEIDNPEILPDDRMYIRFLREAAENQNEEYNLGLMRRDVFDMGHTEEIDIGDGHTLQVQRDGFDHTGDDVIVTVNIATEERRATGSAQLPLEQFYQMLPEDFRNFVNATIAYNMVPEPSLAEQVEQFEAERAAYREQVLSGLTPDQQRIVAAMEIAGFPFNPTETNPIYFGDLEHYPQTFDSWDAAYEAINNAELKSTPGLREQVQKTLHQRTELDEAKALIEDYYIEEFGDNTNIFRDLSEISLAYTTVGDEDIPIQVNADLVNFRIDRYLGDYRLEPREYSSLREMIDTRLNRLDFNELTDVTDDEVAEYREDLDCLEAMEAAIDDNYDGYRLDPAGAAAVVERYGAERVSRILAATVQHYDYDGRISQDNKAWARNIETQGAERTILTHTHPGLINTFTSTVRRIEMEQQAAREQVKAPSEAAPQTPAGRIDFYGFNGRIQESVEYTDPDRLIADAKKESSYGSPMRIVFYRDRDGNTMDRSFLQDLESSPLGIETEDAPGAEEERLTQPVQDSGRIRSSIEQTDNGLLLRISGEGAMQNYLTMQERPWQEQAGQITQVQVDEGITYIGSRAFYRMPELQTVTLPSTVRELGYFAMEDCGKLREIQFSGTAQEWDAVKKGWDSLPSQFTQEDYQRRLDQLQQQPGMKDTYLPVAARKDADGRGETVSSDFTKDALVRSDGSGGSVRIVSNDFRLETLDVSKAEEKEEQRNPEPVKEPEAADASDSWDDWGMEM